MSIESSKRVMKIAGFLTIAGAVMAILGGGLIALTGGIGTQVPEIQADSQMQESVQVLLTGGIIEIISGVLSLIEGFCSYSAGKNEKHIKAAWFFAFIAMTGSILRVASFFLKPVSDTKTIISIFLALVMNVIIFIAANSLKKAKA